VRSQLRSKHIADDFRERLRLAQANQTTAQQVATAVDKERRALRIGGLVTVAVLVVAAVASFLFYRRTQEQNTRVYAAITRLQSGVLTQQQLIERSRQAAEDRERARTADVDLQRSQLEQERRALESQIANSKADDVAALDSQLTSIEGRIHKLETEGKVAQTIIQSYEPSVCIIHVWLAFRDRATGLRLHYAALNSAGHPTTDEHNNPLLSLTGRGPEVRLDIFGTGFLASAGGQILTNHHVAEPWWENDEMKDMLDQGLEPVILDMTAYFPHVDHGITIATEKISSAADVAVVKGNVSRLRIKPIGLAQGRRGAVNGGAVVLLGYPTALGSTRRRSVPSRPKVISNRSWKSLPAATSSGLSPPRGISATCCPTKSSMMPRPLLAAPVVRYSTTRAKS
jgi:hypothetical protein